MEATVEAKIGLEAWLKQQRHLLAIEKQEEVQQSNSQLNDLSAKECEARGTSILSLRVASLQSGLFGRSVVELKHGSRPQLPANRITVGDIVGLKSSRDPVDSQYVSGGLTGVVSKVTDTSISVACDKLDEVDLPPEPLRIDQLANEVTYNKLEEGLRALERSAGHDLGARVVNVVFHGKRPERGTSRPFKPFNQNLNSSQLGAISFALSSKDVALIHGPPGTGKTTVVVELIRQLVAQDLKILVCAPSNVAVDNIVERLVVPIKGSQPRVLRLGHPSRMLPQILRHCLDARVQASDATEIVGDIRKELNSVYKNIMKSKSKDAKRELRKELKILRKELRQREEGAVKEIVRQSNVICATNIGAGMRTLEQVEFDVVVIDEAAQALEASCWIPILKGARVVLAGDHNQLPPTIKSPQAEREGLGVTLFDRIHRLYQDEVAVMLDTQYRMNHLICSWASDALYGGRLLSDETVAGHTLADIITLSFEEDDPEVHSVLVLVDTEGCDCEEQTHETSESKFNAGEASIVARHVHRLVRAGLPQENIAVITPYNAQVELLKCLISPSMPKVQVRSVDGFQGGEREAVILSLVRSNKRGEVGFLADRRRLNVAVTRAKRHCAIICDPSTVCQDEFIAGLVDHLQSHGLCISGKSYEGDEDLPESSMPESFLRPRQTPKASQVPKKTAKKSKKPSEAAMPKYALSSRPSSSHNHASNQSKVINQPHAEEDELDDASMEIVDQVQKFSKADNASTLSFPSTLTAFQRRLVHATAEELGLAHDSYGTGTERYVMITKAPEPQIQSQKRQHEQDREVQEVKSDEERPAGLKPSLYVLESSSSEDEVEGKPAADLLSGNVLLKQLHEERLRRAASLAPPNAEASFSMSAKEQQKPSSKRKKGKKQAKSKGHGKTAEEELQEIEAMTQALDMAVHQASKCWFGCGKRVELIGSTCAHCKNRFCISHGIPEVHGCGSAAREEASKAFKRQAQIVGGVLSGSSKPNTLKPSQRATVKNELRKKLEAQAGKRKPKEPAKSKK